MEPARPNRNSMEFAASFKVRLNSAREGSSEALGSLLEDFKPDLERTALRELSAAFQVKAEGVDLVQETFLSAVGRFADFRGQSWPEWAGWLTHILYNAGAALRRGFEAQKRSLGRELTLEASHHGRRASVALSPHEQVVRFQRREDVRAAVRQLPQSYRVIVKLRTKRDSSFGEIAKRIGATQEGVRKKWHRAITILAGQLKERGADRDP